MEKEKNEIERIKSEGVSSRPESVSLSEIFKGKICFVVHPDGKYVDYIKHVIENIEQVMGEFNVTAETLGNAIGSQESNFEKVLELSKKCILGVVILDGLRPNVLFEYGLLKGLEKPIIALKDEDAYISVEGLCLNEKLKEKIQKLGNPKLDVDKHLSDVKDLHCIKYDWREPEKFKEILKEQFIKNKDGIISESAKSMMTEDIEKKRKVIRDKFSGLFNKLVEYGLKLIKIEPDEVDKISNEIDGLAKKHNIKLLPSYYLRLGNIYYHSTRFKETLKACDKAIEIKPDFAEAWYNKGIALGELGRHEEELKACDEAIKIKPDYAEALNNKGIALGELGRHEEALKAFDKAIEIKPDYADAWNNKGVTLGELGRYEEELKAFDEVIKIKPDYADAWNNKGVALGKLGRYEETLKACDKVIELKPDDADAWYNKACCYSLRGDKENALKNLTKAIELNTEYKEKAKKDEDFKNLWDDEDFKKIAG
jgi:tetratricopeptide (TPR) repeat protein